MGEKGGGCVNMLRGYLGPKLGKTHSTDLEEAIHVQLANEARKLSFTYVLALEDIVREFSAS